MPPKKPVRDPRTVGDLAVGDRFYYRVAGVLIPLEVTNEKLNSGVLCRTYDAFVLQPDAIVEQLESRGRERLASFDAGGTKDPLTDA